MPWKQQEPTVMGAAPATAAVGASMPNTPAGAAAEAGAGAGAWEGTGVMDCLGELPAPVAGIALAAGVQSGVAAAAAAAAWALFATGRVLLQARLEGVRDRERSAPSCRTVTVIGELRQPTLLALATTAADLFGRLRTEPAAWSTAGMLLKEPPSVGAGLLSSCGREDVAVICG
mmetsp:Transcript_45605/g.108522  ORF Transcript_45605/g.108522 Transcript_45605/m.108522 type:complete len:174 (+) Transcript_45605:427-948(+)